MNDIGRSIHTARAFDFLRAPIVLEDAPAGGQNQQLVEIRVPMQASLLFFVVAAFGQCFNVKKAEDRAWPVFAVKKGRRARDTVLDL